MKQYLTYGMVGGSLRAFIGAVHRVGAGFEGLATLAAGCFSTHPDRNLECGRFYRLDEDRVYDTYAEMARREAERSDGIDYAVIAAPNSEHYAAARAFLENGIPVFCEKPLCFTPEEGEALLALARQKDVPFCVNYSYTGNVMVKEARQLVRQGYIGDVIDVNAEYLQEYLVDDVGKGDTTMNTLSSWRKNPAVAGASNCVGDIGSHIENTVSYITGLKLRRVAAVLDHFGQPLDLNANMLVEFDNGAHGVFCSSQVCVGHMNGLVVRIFGTEGAIEWVQEEPNTLKVTKKGQPTQIYHRGMAYISPEAARVSRLPTGHPEGVYEAFANMYAVWHRALLKRANGEPLTPADTDYPGLEEGIAGVRFIRAAVESSQNGAKWTDV